MTSSSQHNHRFLSIDLLRSFAIIGMIIFHFAFVLDFLGYKEIPIQKGFWLLLARTVQFTFLSLVGISMRICYQNNPKNFFSKQSKRAIKILLLATLVTISTLIFTPQYFIKFGILHHIATAIILLIPLSRFPKTSLLLALATQLLSPIINATTTSFIPAYFLGFQVPSVGPSLDYFPILPWISISLLGIFIGSFFKTKTAPAPKHQQKIFHILSYPGKKSLLIYMIHIPIILLILKTYDILTS